jgi:hypothetical protein
MRARCFPAEVALLLLEVLLLRPAQPNNPLDFGAGVDDVAEEVEFRLSQEGRKPDTRCMLGEGNEAPLCRRRGRSGDDRTERIKSEAKEEAQQSSPVCRGVAQVDDGRRCPSRGRW